MFEQLADIGERLAVLERQLADPQLVTQQDRYQNLVREHAVVARLAELYGQYQKICGQISDNEEIIRTTGEEPELVALWPAAENVPKACICARFD